MCISGRIPPFHLSWHCALDLRSTSRHVNEANRCLSVTSKSRSCNVLTLNEVSCHCQGVPIWLYPSLIFNSRGVLGTVDLLTWSITIIRTVLSLCNTSHPKIRFCWPTDYPRTPYQLRKFYMVDPWFFCSHSTYFCPTFLLCNRITPLLLKSKSGKFKLHSWLVCLSVQIDHQSLRLDIRPSLRL